MKDTLSLIFIRWQFSLLSNNSEIPPGESYVIIGTPKDNDSKNVLGEPSNKLVDKKVGSI